MNQKKTCISCFLVFILFIFLGCISFFLHADPKKIEPSISYFVSPLMDKLKLVKASLKPINGSHIMKLELIRAFDSDEVDPQAPIFFHSVVKTKDGHFLFTDYSSYKIHMVSPEKKLLTSFLSKGEGPAEFLYGPFTIQPQDNFIFVNGKRKIIRFDNKGHYIDEIHLKGDYRKIYIIDNQKFLANYFFLNPQKKIEETKESNLVQHYRCSIFSKDEEIIDTYIDAPGAGETQINEKVGGNTIRLNFFSIFVSPEILHIFDPQSNRLIICLTSHYRIYSIDMSNQIGFIIEKQHNTPSLSIDDREELVANSFRQQPPHIKKIIERELPSNFCTIYSIHLLPGGHIAVMTITGIHSLPNIDIFDSKGHYLYHFQCPEMNKKANLTFLGANLASLEENEEGDTLFREYKIVNLNLK